MTVSFRRSALAVAALAAAATLAPAAVSAQSYGYGNQSYGYGNQGYAQPYGQNQGYGQTYGNSTGRYGYRDRCSTLAEGRTGAGALIGGGIGAVAGSQIAGRGNRTGASIIGGVLGAVIGAQVGRASNDQCRSEGSGYGYNYDNSTYAPPAQSYSRNDRYDDRGYSSGRYDDRGYSSDRRYSTDRSGYAVSDDGYYIYDPRRGWVPR